MIKKLLFLLVLTSMVGVTAQAANSGMYKDLDAIVTALHEAFADDLERIQSAFPASLHTEFDEALTVVKREIDTIKPRFAAVVNDVLTQRQATMLIDYLRNVHAVTLTTLDELMRFADVCSTEDGRARTNWACGRYCPVLLKDIPHNDAPYAQRAAWFKEFEKVDLHDAALNSGKKFMCRCTYVEFTVAWEKQTSCKGPLIEYLKIFNDAIAFPYVLFNNFYVKHGWQERFERGTNVYALVNYVTEQLLSALD
jgi:hypothetical protein